jgi:hypothetical protein
MTHKPNSWQINPDGSYSYSGDYPTYTWSLHANEWVYTNPSMMRAIDECVQNMLTYPDAERIINKLKANGE